MIKKQFVTITIDKDIIPKLKNKLKADGRKLSTLVNKFLIDWVNGTG